MNNRYVIVTSNNFSSPMIRDEAIKKVKEYDQKGISGYIVSEEEARRIGSPTNFNEPKWD